jgi:hypothetical protein
MNNLEKIADELVTSLTKGTPKDYSNFRNITTKKFYCQSKIEGRFTCNNQCEHCEEYYKPLEI